MFESDFTNTCGKKCPLMSSGMPSNLRNESEDPHQGDVNSCKRVLRSRDKVGSFDIYNGVLCVNQCTKHLSEPSPQLWMQYKLNITINFKLI